MVDKKRKSKRLSTRKKNKIIKKIRKQDKDRRKEFRLKNKSKAKIPKHILMTDEEVQRLNDIKNNERDRKNIIIEKENSFKKFLKEHDMFLLLVDPRDVFSIPNFDIFEDKSFCLVLNYKNDIPVERLFEFYENANKKYKTFIVSKDVCYDKLESFNNEFYEFINSNKLSIGILGEKQVGKNYIRNLVTNSKTYLLESEQGLSSLLRGCVNMRNVLYKDLIKKLIDQNIDKELLSIYFSIEHCNSYESFVELMANKYKISKDKDEKVCKILIDEFINKKITFFYDLNKDLQIIFNK